ncbi:hypothetical protein [Cystobacter ferrugineus]|uniref:Uncharacterized protein n=1 Tax=Cystobacter ferrugineus TaxID=83449 RepID=A0A1L9ATT2_9BACT|nr:hypothetical protein [Cystobacter ferrugineus]OJH33420.1 hypothetical protein BON30_48725 [Cystobacter ferrugineus]
MLKTNPPSILPSPSSSLRPVPQSANQSLSDLLKNLTQLANPTQTTEKAPDSYQETQLLEKGLDSYQERVRDATQDISGEAFVNPDADVTKVDLTDPAAVAKLAEVLGYSLEPQSLDDLPESASSMNGAPADPFARNALGVTKKAAVQGLDKRSSDSPFDGALVGVDKTIKREDLVGKKDLPPVGVHDIEGFTPKNKNSYTGETIIQVNGIATTLDEQKKALQATADATGARVVGIHNATDGFVQDLGQSIGDKTGLGTNVAVDSLRDVVLQELRAGRPVHLAAHSQGGLITSRALGEVAEQLKKEGRDPKLLARIKVETFGAAAGRYPDGPQYVHYVNKADNVSDLFGVEGHTSFFANPGRDAYGRPAVVNHFDDSAGLVASHSYQDIYLKHRDDFDLAYSGPGLVIQVPNRSRGIKLRLD